MSLGLAMAREEEKGREGKRRSRESKRAGSRGIILNLVRARAIAEADFP